MIDAEEIRKRWAHLPAVDPRDAWTWEAPYQLVEALVAAPKDIAWLLGEIKRLRDAGRCDCCGYPLCSGCAE